MGAKGSKKSANLPQQRSATHVKHHFEAQKVQRTNQNEDAISAAYRKLQEETAHLSAQRKKHEEAVLELQEEIANLAVQKKLQEEEYITVQRKLQEEAANRKLEEDTAKRKLLEEAAKKKLLEEAAKKKHEEETAKKKLKEEIALKKMYLELVANEKIREDAAKKIQEEAVIKKLKEEALKIKLKEEIAVQKKILENAFQRKLEEDATRRKLQEEAFKKNLEKEAVERKLQEEAAKNKLEEEAAMKIHEQPTMIIRDLPKKVAVLQYCYTCYKQSSQDFFKCDKGHSSCNDCKKSLRNCGICSGAISCRRSYNTKQDFSLHTRVPCPYRIDGCKLNIKLKNMETHVKECPFQEHDCPLSTVFGTCKWQGKIFDLSGHFKAVHPNCFIEVGSELEFGNIHKNRRFVRLIENGYHFIFHIKISEVDRKIYMTVQLIGTKHSAMNYLYEIHVFNNSDINRKYVYEDKCNSTIDNIDDIFLKGECAVLTMEYANTFVNNGSMSLKCFIK